MLELKFKKMNSKNTIFIVLAAIASFHFLNIGGNLFGKTFTSDKECFDYVKYNAIANEKIFAGGLSCKFIFPTGHDERTEARRDFGKCLINKYDQIIDDSSGTRIVNACANSAGTNDIGIILSKKFSASERMAEALEEHRRQLQSQYEEAKHDQILQNMLRPPMNCIMIGDIMNCS